MSVNWFRVMIIYCAVSGPLVVRPDSGDPTAVVLKVLQILGSKFGTKVNSKGYKVLPPYIRVVQVSSGCFYAIM